MHADDHEQLELRLKVTFAWWVHRYLDILGFMAWLMNTEPDYEKAARVMMMGATATIQTSKTE